MSEIVYEVVNSAATEAIVGLYRAGNWWHEDPASRAIIPQMIRGSFCFLVAREPDGRIVGMGRVISDGVSDAYIQDVVVLEAYRGGGIGREIVHRLTERCLEARIGWIGLVAEPGTRAFYEPLGFHALAGYEPMLHGDEPGGR
ncbi:MAG: GNAT family N-acetyltransferase [Thermoanaerobaculaceae bacterium]|jgi:GNAT superfamily N-acetyltransferase